MMKTLLTFIVLTTTLFAQVKDSNPLNVDTSVTDLKPIEKEVIIFKKKEYKPTSGFKASARPESEFMNQQKESMEQSARNTTP